jgi:hypothetical protein
MKRPCACLQANGCEVVIPAAQPAAARCMFTPESAMWPGGWRAGTSTRFSGQRGGYDAIITNAAGCGSTLKEYGELLAHDGDYATRALQFSAADEGRDRVSGLDRTESGHEPVNATVTYQDSCHLAHGQKIRSAPRQLLRFPELNFARCRWPTPAAAAPASTTRCIPICRCDPRKEDGQREHRRRADCGDGESRLHAATSRECGRNGDRKGVARRPRSNWRSLVRASVMA